MTTVVAGSTKLIQKINRLLKLSPEETDAVASLTFQTEQVSHHTLLVREGERVTRCCLLIEGYSVRHKTNRNGMRQIVAIHMPGDMLDLQHLLLDRADHNLQTITNATVGWIEIKRLKKVMLAFPRIAEAFAREALIDASMFREWLLNVGRRDAKTRVAHLICEFVARREAMGDMRAEEVMLPFTQELVGDATGLTSVHVNRMLRRLSEEGALNRQNGAVTIADWQRLRNIAEFDPSYMHQLVEERVGS